MSSGDHLVVMPVCSSMDAANIFKDFVTGKDFASITDFVVALNGYKATTGFDFAIHKDESKQTNGFSFFYSCIRENCDAWFRLTPKGTTLRVTEFEVTHDHPGTGSFILFSILLKHYLRGLNIDYNHAA